MFGVSVDGLVNDFERAAGRAPGLGSERTAAAGRATQSATRSRAPGTTYPGSIGIEISTTAMGSSAVVGTDEPEGWRLEVGFHGTDSLGRHYEQSGHPHFGPAFDAQVEPYVEAMSQIVDIA